jgi:hypothetical protein
VKTPGRAAREAAEQYDRRRYHNEVSGHLI